MTNSYTARDLADKICYRGQEQAARILLIKMNTVPVEKIAVMTALDVCEAILDKYEFIMSDSEDILLVEKDKLQDFKKIAVWLSR
ncbi:hypothetical protein [uncultured Phascolarctobacterium sp.]|jgi:hypothetical protein|uniref:hypothetical protein n=1 Tax=uncultured Phascolarctobacterium sp. TaxID=512296 RepID=UPI0025F1DD09|nr:hypothetical protein [uncultured Phascolarctobacterium sp.]